MPSVTSAGLEFGSTIRVRILPRLAPSIRALSSSSLGRPRKNWRRKNTPKAPAAPGTISAQQGVQPAEPVISRKFGIRKMKPGRTGWR